LAVTATLPVNVNLQVFALFPPLEHPPDQMASLPFVTLSVIDVPVVNEADAVLPTGTLIPAGLEVTLFPPLPLPVTVNVAVGAPGVTVSKAVREAPPPLAVIVTGVDAVTEDVAMAKVALVAPAGTVTLAGTLPAAELLLLRVTSAPPATAAAVRETVPCAAEPPVTDVGFTVTAFRVGCTTVEGVSVKIADRVTPPPVTEMVTAVVVATGVVVNGNIPTLAVPEMNADAGTTAAGLLAVTGRLVSPVAGAVNVTVARTVPDPPIRVEGFSVIEAGVDWGRTPTVPFTLAPFHVAVRLAVVKAGTGFVARVKDVANDPAGTVTVAGGMAAAESLVTATTAPPAGASPFR
jgi:hypothetical protein